MKKIICILCVLTLTLSLFGCGSKGGKSNEANSNQGSKVSENNFNKTGLPILKEKETFEIYIPQMSNLIDAKDKPVYIQSVKDTNIDVKWTEIPKSSWQEKINILFSTNSLPDAFLGQIKVGQRFEQLMPLDEYLIEEYAPNVVAFLNSRPEYWDILKAPDGHIYSLPTGDESYWNIVDKQLNVNEKWLEAVGKEAPTNIDEFYDVLKAFKDGDPNGNGDTTDEIPFTFSEFWGWGTSLGDMFGPFGVLENDVHVYVDNDQVLFGAEQRGYYDALQFFHKLYSEDLMDKEALSHSIDQFDAKKDEKENKVGFFIDYGERYDFGDIPIILKGEDGKVMINLNGMEKKEGFSITKTCKNPAALIRWYDYANSSEKMIMEWNRGSEGETWKFSEDGEKLIQIQDPEVFKKYGIKGEKMAILRNYLSFGCNAPGFLHIGMTDKFIEQNNSLKPGLNKEILNENWGYNSLPVGFATQENIERRALLLADIDTYLKKFIAESIVHGIDDEKWEEHLDALKKLKVEEYKALVEELL
ncbi:ABC transporter substrate-binding protein [Vallitalea longa]|uniref:ABC transporter substrate-binding protein n=1 Tax=Vallitalea longa TaxID=2936439 RepID=A0A9W5YBK4_9FIRM|nr:extracellular solute-binding protein [Vallitalea longa]GKX29363.1 ABC transporter substrate-binding protein [Vallitalea longa]